MSWRRIEGGETEGVGVVRIVGVVGVVRVIGVVGGNYKWRLNGSVICNDVEEDLSNGRILVNL
ncbi:MAG: hypothetical protein II951_05900 [Bacteroidales bacterium]|nr:hypothetical protein [Bacteroidales bacterium]